MKHWTESDIPDLHGRVALVTDANRGLGLETTRALAAHGAHVIMAVRNLNQGYEERSTSPAENWSARGALPTRGGIPG